MKNNIILFLLLFILNGCSSAEYHLSDLVNAHHLRYPDITTRDVYKMLYQCVFGIKHLLKDTLMSKKYLEREYESISPKDEPLFENISIDGTIVRINLRKFKYNKLSLDKLFEVMKLSAESINGDSKKLKKIWQEFKDIASDKKYSFDKDEIKKYTEKITDTPPEEHHSEIYIQKYMPSYRVVKRDIFLKYFPEIK